MLKEKIEAALNKQLNEELESSYIYLAISAYFEAQNYSGFANWMKIQSTEEYGHAMKIYGYLVQRGGKIKLTAIAEPKIEWDSVTSAFEFTFNHEKKITQLIYSLVDLSIDEKDHATSNFLQWFVTEQVEEEATVEGIKAKLAKMSGSENGLFMLDRDMARRIQG